MERDEKRNGSNDALGEVADKKEEKEAEEKEAEEERDSSSSDVFVHHSEKPKAVDVREISSGSEDDCDDSAFVERKRKRGRKSSVREKEIAKNTQDSSRSKTNRNPSSSAPAQETICIDSDEEEDGDLAAASRSNEALRHLQESFALARARREKCDRTLATVASVANQILDVDDDSDEPPPEKNPAHIATAPTVSLLVRFADKTELKFRMSEAESFGKMYDYLVTHKALQPNGFRLLVDGETLSRKSTPNDLDLESGDLIDVAIP